LTLLTFDMLHDTHPKMTTNWVKRVRKVLIIGFLFSFFRELGGVLYLEVHQWRFVPSVVDQRLSSLVLESQILDAEWALTPPRVVRGQSVPVCSQRHVPFGSHLNIITHCKLATALGVVPPEPLFPHNRPIHGRFHLVQPKVPRCRPYLAPQHNPRIRHITYHPNTVLLDIIRRRTAHKAKKG
jgi:hypothetical protein